MVFINLERQVRLLRLPADSSGDNTRNPHLQPWKPRTPVEVEAEWAWSGAADALAAVAGVQRISARTVRWSLRDLRDIYTWPSQAWSPAEQVTI